MLESFAEQQVGFRFFWMKLFIFLFLFQFSFSVTPLASENDCQPIYVRWERASLERTARFSGSFLLDACARACTNNYNPASKEKRIECVAFNHKQGENSPGDDCQLFEESQLADVDHDVIARDNYSFYRKYCVKSHKVCKSRFHFDLVVDSYMSEPEVAKSLGARQVEQCLAYCLEERSFTCRSASYNRTGGTCLLSTHNRLSKPGYVKLNNNPNWRVDYYENNCYNDSFTFSHECHPDGISVNVESKYAYSGALYGLYDFFTCRLEPTNMTKFSYFFPLSSVSKNCTDSITRQSDEIVLDVVLSTDGVQPLYFLTDKDVLYQARCKGDGTDLPKPTAIGVIVGFKPQEEPSSVPVEQHLNISSSTTTDGSAHGNDDANSTNSSTTETLWSSHSSSTTSSNRLFGTAEASTSTSIVGKNIETTTDHQQSTAAQRSQNHTGGGKGTHELLLHSKKPAVFKTFGTARTKLGKVWPTGSSRLTTYKQTRLSTSWVLYGKKQVDVLPSIDLRSSEILVKNGSDEYASPGSAAASTGTSFNSTALLWSTLASTTANFTDQSISSSSVLPTPSSTVSTSYLLNASSSQPFSTSTNPPITSFGFTSSSTAQPTISTTSQATTASSSLASTTSSASTVDELTTSSTSVLPTSYHSSSTNAATDSTTPDILSTVEPTLRTATLPLSTDSAIANSHSVAAGSDSSLATAVPNSTTSILTHPSSSTTTSTSTPFANTAGTTSVPTSSQTLQHTTTTTTSNATSHNTTDSPYSLVWHRLSTPVTLEVLDITPSVEKQASRTTADRSVTSSSTTTTSGDDDSSLVDFHRQTTTAASPSTSTTTTEAASLFGAQNTISDGPPIPDQLLTRTTTTTAATSSTTAPTSTSSLAGTVATSSTHTVPTPTAATSTTSARRRTTTTHPWWSSFNATNGEDLSLNATAVAVSTTEEPREINFEILFNGVPTKAVIVNTPVSLEFTPGPLLPISPLQMALVECKVEPTRSKFSYEPVYLVRNGCPADGVGLVDPIRITSRGITAQMGPLRYTDSAESLYSCIVRVCQSQCPAFSCFDIDGTPYLSYGRRRKRRQLNAFGLSYRDLKVKRKLVVLNSQYALQNYLRNGLIPPDEETLFPLNG